MTLLCPYDGTPLVTTDRNTYWCRECPHPWIIHTDTSHDFTFNLAAPYAQLVIDIDRCFRPTGKKKVA